MAEKAHPLTTEKTVVVQRWDRYLPKEIRDIQGKQVFRMAIERYESVDFSAAEFHAIRDSFPCVFDEGCELVCRKDTAAGGPPGVLDRPPLEYTGTKVPPMQQGEALIAPSVAPRDGSADPLERADALLTWALAEPASAGSYACEELSRDDITPEWRNALILAVEEMSFTDDDLRRRLAGRLLSLARSFASSGEPDIETVACSALRKFASLIPEQETAALSDFLKPTLSVDTRLTALQCVVHTFESGPPAEAIQLTPMADEIAGLVVKLLDQDVFMPGMVAAMALEGIHALAAIGDRRVAQLIGRAKELGRPWFVALLSEELAATLESWQKLRPGSLPAVAAMKANVEALGEVANVADDEHAMSVATQG